MSVFVAMPFGHPFDDVFNFGILLLSESLPGWRIYITRTDTVAPAAYDLLAHVRACIANADVVVADFSSGNLNVAMEIGIATALQKHVIIISHSNGELPGDFKSILCLKYALDDLESMRMRLSNHIARHAQRLLSQHAVTAIGSAAPAMWLDPASAPRPSVPREAIQRRMEGRTLRDKGELEAAEVELTAAIEIYPGFYEARYELATVKRFLRDEDVAKALAERVIQDATTVNDNVFAYKSYNLLSGIAKRRGDLDEALKCIRKAYDYASLASSPIHVVVLKNRFVLEWMMGNTDQFRRLFGDLMKHKEFDQIRPEISKELGDEFDSLYRKGEL